MPRPSAQQDGAPGSAHWRLGPSPDEEQLILVDNRNRALAPLGKTSVHRHGLHHRAFSIFLVDGDGRILLQRRHPSKYHSGGLWANTCCGHPRWGERTDLAARRRLSEELGLSSPLRFAFRTRYEIRFDNGFSENETVSVMIGPLHGFWRPDPGEIVETALVRFDDLRRALDMRPEAFVYWLRHYVAHHASDLAVGLAQASRG